jgi:hypothetical protein
VTLLTPAASVGTRADVTATHDTFIIFNSKIFPRALPRSGSVPVAIRIEGRVKARKGREPAPLTKIELAIHRAASLFRHGLPVCDISSIDPSSSAEARAACSGSQIGYGRIKAESKFPGQPHFFFDGRAAVFNGRLQDGRPAILIHVFNAKPPSSFVFPFAISRRQGLFGTLLTADVRISRWSRITDFKLVLNRTFRYKGRPRSFLSASCPAPKGFTVGVSPFVRATLSFGDGTKSEIAVVSSCRVAD